METRIIIYDREEGELLGGLRLTEEQVNLLHQLRENDCLRDRFIFVDISDIEFEEP